MLNYNLRLYCKYFNFKLYLRSFCKDNSNCKIVAHLLDLPESKVLVYLKKYNLTKKNPDLIEGSIKYCRQLGYKSQDILTTRGLLSVHPLALEHHYLSLEEGGFKNIQPEILGSSIRYMRKSINYLKEKNLINKNEDVTEKFLSYIKDSNFVEYFRQTYYNLPKCQDLTTWIDTHFSILTAFLRYRLKASSDDLIKLFRIHKMIRYKSFRVIEENIDIARSLDIYPERILRYGYILNNYPKYTKETLEAFPNLGGYDTRKLMKAYPKLIMTSPTNILKILNILEEYNIPEQAVRSTPNIFCVSPETVRYRLETVENSSELKGLLKHRRILSFILHHNRANSRLTFLQQLKLKCANFTVLETGLVDKFESYIREGKDMNSVSTVQAILKTIFPDMDKTLVYNQLKKHKYHLYVPVKDMYESYKFLQDHCFKPDSIFQVLCLILYPVTKIKNTLDQLKNDPKIIFDRLDEVTQLNLVLYEIEKHHHFTGNGIWRDIGLVDDLADKTLE